MKIISHRGFLNGNNEMYEVDQNHLEKLFYDTPFDVEIDIRQYDSNFFIGHDEFEASKIDKSFLDKWTDRLWIHAKDISTLEYILSHCPDWNVFCHQNDECALTSKRYIWQFPDQITSTKRSVLVINEHLHFLQRLWTTRNHNKIHGICTDYPEFAWKLLSE
jgi:hypothetical protein